MNQNIVMQMQGTIKADVQPAQMKQGVFVHTYKSRRCVGARCFELLSKDGKHLLLL